MKKFFNKYWVHLLILILGLSISWPIFQPGYFSHHDDLQVMRVFEMRKCIEDLQIPCRWVPDLGFGNGYPLFNYYNVLPYYIGGLASFVLGFINSAKFLFLISVILAPFSMFFLMRELFGKYPALVASTLYAFAPYRALDIYVRGAVSESFAIAIIPLVFYFALKVVREGHLKNKILLSLSIGAFLASHNIMTLLFSPLIVAFFAIILWKESKLKIYQVIRFSILGVGLAAFFIIPAFMEKNLVQVDNLTKLELDFRAHFATVPQLFLDRSWGYGASFPGSGDTISFQLGLPHWPLVIVSIPLLFLLFRNNRKLFFLSLAVLIFFLLSIFMTHNKSAFVWEKIGILRFTQFPWRFLSVSIFTASVLGGFVIFFLKSSLQKVTTVILMSVIVFLNWNYFKPNEFYYNLTDQEKLSGILWQTQQKASILDYLPNTAVEPREGAPGSPIILSGQVRIENFDNRSNRWKLDAKVESETQIEMPVFDFPNWQVYVNGKKIDHTNKNYLGRISFVLDKGEYIVTGRFTDTWVRTLSNLISLVSIFIVGYLYYGKYRKNN